MCCKDKKEFSPIIMGPCPKPRDLTVYGQKHDGTRAVQDIAIWIVKGWNNV